eukprot:GAHX01001761.1.p1 GENE.GAHX01001761.1~~GAHX01001761.1.p1  ORF type:complete len:374 (+),score=60.65 GAHX01001761.1:2677-3798(+)
MPSAVITSSSVESFKILNFMQTSETSEPYVELTEAPDNEYHEGTFLLSAGADSFILTWDLKNMEIVSSLSIPNPPIAKIIPQSNSSNVTLLSNYKAYGLDLTKNSIENSFRLTNGTLMGGYHSTTNSNILLWISETGSIGIKDYREKNGEREVRITQFINDYQIIDTDRIVVLNESSELISCNINDFVQITKGRSDYDFLNFKRNNTSMIALDFNKGLSNSQTKEISQFYCTEQKFIYYSSFAGNFYRSYFSIEEHNKYSIRNEEKLPHAGIPKYSTLIKNIECGDGKDDQIVLGNMDGSIYKFCDQAIINDFTVLDAHKQAVWDFQIKNDLAFSCSTDSTIRVWDIKQNINTSILHGHAKPVYSMYFINKNM